MEVRCPHCHSPIDLTSDSPLSAITCPSCGSSFSLLGEAETATHGPSQAKTLGHFTLIEQIGIGSFGSVWRARDSELDRTVAVKVPRKGQLAPEEADQFLREARAAAQLRHPNIVTVYEVGREGETVFLVSEYIAGITLGEWLSAKRPSAREAAEMCAKAADALHHAHEAGVVHRDLKPANIMLDESGEPHIMDFGLARREAGEVTMTVEGRVLDTPAYMSPEQAKGEAHHAGRQSDVYSLGVILFELLTGERPFRGSARMLMHQIIHDDAPSPRRLTATTPRDLETICLKCLEKEPSKRYGAASELSKELRRFLAGEPIHARPITRVGRLSRWCGRNPKTATLAFALIAALLAGFSGISWQWHRAETATNELERRVRSQYRQLYAADMLRACRAWESGDLLAVENLLKKYVSTVESEDLRSFEWYYLWRVWRHVAATKVIDCESVRLAISANGRRIVVAGDPGRIIPFEQVDGQWVRGESFGDAYLFRMYVAISPDSNTLAYLPPHRLAVILRDLDTSRDKTRIPVNSVVNVVSFSPNGRTLAIGCDDGSVLIWDLESAMGTEPLQTGSDPIWSLEFSPDSRHLVSGATRGIIRSYDMRTMTVEWEMKGHAARVNDVSWSPDGKWLVTASSDRTAGIWDAATARQLRTLAGARDEVRMAEFSPNGKLLATGARDGSIRMWTVPDFGQETTVSGYNCRFALGFFPDNRLLFGARPGWLCISNPGTLDPNSHIDYRQTAGEESAAVGAEELACWRQGPIVAVIQGGRLQLWKMDDGSLVELDARLLGIRESNVAACIDISGDGLLAVGGIDSGNVNVVDLSGKREPKTLLAPRSLECRAVAFSPSGGRLAAAYANGTIVVFDLEKGRILFDRQTQPIEGRQSVCFCGDEGKLFLGSAVAQLWDIERDRLIAQLGGTGTPVWRASSSPDGSLVAFLRSDAGEIELWNTLAYKRKLLGHHALGAIGFGFQPDGKTLVSVGSSRHLVVWDLTNLEQRLVINTGSSIPTCMTLSRDGTLVVVGARDMTIGLYRAATPREVDVTPGWSTVVPGARASARHTGAHY